MAIVTFSRVLLNGTVNNFLLRFPIEVPRITVKNYHQFRCFLFSWQKSIEINYKDARERLIRLRVCGSPSDRNFVPKSEDSTQSTIFRDAKDT